MADIDDPRVRSPKSSVSGRPWQGVRCQQRTVRALRGRVARDKLRRYGTEFPRVSKMSKGWPRLAFQGLAESWWLPFPSWGRSTSWIIISTDLRGTRCAPKMQKTIIAALEKYRAATGAYPVVPPALDVRTTQLVGPLVEGGYLRAIPIDPPGAEPNHYFSLDGKSFGLWLHLERSGQCRIVVGGPAPAGGATPRPVRFESEDRWASSISLRTHVKNLAALYPRDEAMNLAVGPTAAILPLVSASLNAAIRAIME
jgi:hypothetical protein